LDDTSRIQIAVPDSLCLRSVGSSQESDRPGVRSQQKL